LTLFARCADALVMLGTRTLLRVKSAGEYSLCNHCTVL